jgi:hypothetical protein
VDEPFSLSQYVQASAESSKRTRTIVVVLVIGSVLAFAGLLNSLSTAWMLQRIEMSRSPNSTYVLQKLGFLARSDARAKAGLVTQEDLEALLTAEARRSGQSLETVRLNYADQYRSFYQALVHTYAESAYMIRVPFFGATFDMNDIGIVGGAGFIVILLLLRYSLARELYNLRLSFSLAESHGTLRDAYNFLSMRQVLTTPPIQGRRRSKLLVAIPQLLCVLPILVYSGIITHDFATFTIGTAISSPHTIVLYCVNSACLIAMASLTGASMSMWKKIDREWVVTYNKTRVNRDREEQHATAQT